MYIISHKWKLSSRRKNSTKHWIFIQFAATVMEDDDGDDNSCVKNYYKLKKLLA